MGDCPHAPLVARHFAGSLSANEEQQLREHLPTCAACRGLYQRHGVVAGLDPAARTRQERLGRAIGFRGRRFVAALALFVALRTDEPPEFVSRGSGAAATSHPGSLRIFQAGDGWVKPAAETIRAGDELTFGYTNPAGKKFLAVYAVDATGEVRWYAPTWTDAKDDPRMIPIEAGPRLRGLGKAVKHELPAGKLTVHAVFLDEALSVRQLEARKDDLGLGQPHLVFPLDVTP
jgi:hypothetical protein